MWKCKNCGEQVEKNFGNCWGCGYSRDGMPPKEGVEISSDPVLPNGKRLSSVVATNVNIHSHMLRAPEQQEVVIVDVSIPFWSMVVLMVKWSIAFIPALLILIIIGGLFGGLLGGIGASIFR